MQEQINQLQNSINELLKWKEDRLQQQIAYPIDNISMDIINKNNGKIAIGGIYLSTSSTNPSTSLGYGSWLAVGDGKLLQGITSGTGGTTGIIVATSGATTIASTYTTYYWLRIS